MVERIVDLQSQIPAQGELVVAKFKESDELKAMLKAAQEGGITEKFDEWSCLGYLDKAKMTADLIAAREAKDRESKSKVAADREPKATEGEPFDRAAEKEGDGDDNQAESSEDKDGDGHEA
ncbi:hypothetical protein ACLB2K_051702 [Fragaria x ananassa]